MSELNPRPINSNSNIDRRVKPSKVFPPTAAPVETSAHIPCVVKIEVGPNTIVMWFSSRASCGRCHPIPVCICSDYEYVRRARRRAHPIYAVLLLSTIYNAGTAGGTPGTVIPSSYIYIYPQSP